MHPSLTNCLGRKLSGSRHTYGLGQIANYTLSTAAPNLPDSPDYPSFCAEITTLRPDYPGLFPFTQSSRSSSVSTWSCHLPSMNRSAVHRPTSL